MYAVQTPKIVRFCHTILQNTSPPPCINCTPFSPGHLKQSLLSEFFWPHNPQFLWIFIFLRHNNLWCFCPMLWPLYHKQFQTIIWIFNIICYSTIFTGIMKYKVRCFGWTKVSRRRNKFLSASFRAKTFIFHKKTEFLLL